MSAFFKNFVREKVSFGLMVYIILIYLILNSVLQGIELVIRGTSVEILRPLIILGIIVGWFIGRSDLKNWAVILLSLILGAFVTLVHIGGIDTAIWDLVLSGIRFLWMRIFSGSVPETGDILILLAVIQARTIEVFSNLSSWSKDLLSGFYFYNQVSTLISWGFLMWILAIWFSWITRKKYQPLWGLIPPGILLAILMTYTLEKRILLVLLLGAGLTLVGLINQEEKVREWRAKGIKGIANIHENLTLVVVSLSLGIMLFAGIMPSISIKAISDPIERWLYGSSETGETGTDSTAEVGYFNQNLYTVQRFAGLPRQKLIGSGPELAKRVVMVVDFPNSSLVKQDLPNAARYWRSFSYDQYTGSGWQSSQTVEVEYKPGQEIAKIQSDHFNIITQEIRLSNALRGSLYFAGQPITLDQEVLVSWRTTADIISDVKDVEELVLEDIFAVTLDQILYQVRSLIPAARDDELRQASGDYPDWISSRYLDLPDTISTRVLDLAGEIVANQPTLYDQAKAIETFLRAYPYTLDLPAPPLDRDVTDYFLFDLQTGYCDYYATSMVVLARAVGLPSRVVVGYVGGQYIEENDHYLVTEADAHTWVEVYFNGFGWFPFEPTAAQDLLDDDDLALPLPPELAAPPQTMDSEDKGEFPGWEVGIGAFFFLVLSGWAANRADLQRLSRMDVSDLVLNIYQRLYCYGRWLGLGHYKSDTLYEFDRKIKTKMKLLANSPGREKRLISGSIETSQLTEYAVLANYSVHSLDPDVRKNIILIWRKLRIRLRYAIWIFTWASIWEKIFSVGRKNDQNDMLTYGAADE